MNKLHEELVLLNSQMNNEGRPLNYQTLIFYGPAIAHKVEWDANVYHPRYMIANLDRFKEQWGWLEILTDGSLNDAVTTLTAFRPFLPLDQIDNFWEDVIESAPTRKDL